MEFAFHPETSRIVNAYDARQDQGYLCLFCKHKVYPKPGLVKQAHFAHHANNSACPEYHQGFGAVSISRDFFKDFRTQLSDEAYRTRLNSIIRFLLDRDLLEWFSDFPRCIKPCYEFLGNDSIDSTAATKILAFLSSFSYEVLLQSGCSPDTIRDYRERLKAEAESSISDSPIVLKFPVAGSFGEHYRKLTTLGKYQFVLSYLGSAGFKRDGELSDEGKLLKTLEFRLHDAPGLSFSIPFAEIADLNESVPILKYLADWQLEQLLKRQKLSRGQKSFVQKFLASRRTF